MDIQLTNHVANVHNHKSKIFSNCAYRDLTKEGRDWLDEDFLSRRCTCVLPVAAIREYWKPVNCAQLCLLTLLLAARCHQSLT
ncbi:hypothetical protein V5799_026442 [Amblyomma americanum]|uniref:Uncharacterized protein n=1 Tax=Amblyomma americanum TaxID=6943 RepID=A0AAQ4DIK4_AMBAM